MWATGFDVEDEEATDRASGCSTAGTTSRITANDNALAQAA